MTLLFVCDFLFGLSLGIILALGIEKLIQVWTDRGYGDNK